MIAELKSRFDDNNLPVALWLKELLNCPKADVDAVLETVKLCDNNIESLVWTETAMDILRYRFQDCQEREGIRRCPYVPEASDPTGLKCGSQTVVLRNETAKDVCTSAWLMRSTLTRISLAILRYSPSTMCFCWSRDKQVCGELPFSLLLAFNEIEFSSSIVYNQCFLSEESVLLLGPQEEHWPLRNALILSPRRWLDHQLFKSRTAESDELVMLMRLPCKNFWHWVTGKLFPGSVPDSPAADGPYFAQPFI